MTTARTRAVVEAARLCVAAEEALHGDFAVADVLTVGATMRGLRSALRALDAAPAEPEAAGTVDRCGGAAWVEAGTLPCTLPAGHNGAHLNGPGQATWGAKAAPDPDRLAALEEVARAAQDVWEADERYKSVPASVAAEGGHERRMGVLGAALSRLRGEPRAEVEDGWYRGGIKRREPDGTPVAEPRAEHRWVRSLRFVRCSECGAEDDNGTPVCPGRPAPAGEKPDGGV